MFYFIRYTVINNVFYTINVTNSKSVKYYNIKVRLLLLFIFIIIIKDRVNSVISLFYDVHYI